MAIFMKYGDLNGEVTTTGYEEWIEVFVGAVGHRTRHQQRRRRRIQARGIGAQRF
jgi:hypothetical protein